MDPNGDGDMSDHLDVINMSLGSPFGEPADPSAISTNNAAAVGIIVATSAGNEGDIPVHHGRAWRGQLCNLHRREHSGRHDCRRA